MSQDERVRVSAPDMPFKIHLEIDPRYFAQPQKIQNVRRMSRREAAIRIQSLYRGWHCRRSTIIDKKLNRIVNSIIINYVGEYIASPEFLHSVLFSASNPMDTALIMLLDDILTEYSTLVCRTVVSECLREMMDVVRRRQRRYVAPSDDPVLYNAAQLRDKYGQYQGYGPALMEYLYEVITDNEVNTVVTSVVRGTVSDMLHQHIVNNVVTGVYAELTDTVMTAAVMSIYNELAVDSAAAECIDDIVMSLTTQCVQEYYDTIPTDMLDNAVSLALRSLALQHVTELYSANNNNVK